MPDYALPSWENPDTSEGAVLARILAQRRQQQQEQQRIGLERQQVGMEGQRLQAELQQAAQARTEAARKAALRQQYSAAFSALNPNNPDYAAQARALALRMAIDMGGNVSGNMLPPAPITATPLIQSSSPPNPKTQPSPAFTGQLQDILKGAGVQPPPTSAPTTSAWAQPPMLLSNGRVVKGIPVPPPKTTVIPRGAIGILPNGERITNAPPPSTTGFNLSPGQIRFNATGTPIATNTLPRLSTPPRQGMTPDAQRNSDWRAAVANLKNIDTQLQDTTLTDDQKKALQTKRARIQAWIDSVTPMIESPTNQPATTPSATNAPAANFRYYLQTQDLVPVQ